MTGTRSVMAERLKIGMLKAVRQVAGVGARTAWYNMRNRGETLQLLHEARVAIPFRGSLKLGFGPGYSSQDSSILLDHLEDVLWNAHTVPFCPCGAG